MIRRIASLALLVAIIAAPAAKSQVTPEQQQRLYQLGERLEQEEQREYARAVELARERGLPIRKRLPDGRLMQLERFEYGRPMYIADENTDAAETIGTAALHPEGSDSLSLTGAGQTLGMWEIGAARGSHRELEGRITQRDNGGNFGTAGHATHVAGIMIGAGVRSEAQGMSYEANLDSYTAGGGNGEMADAAADGLPVSNHSYGYLAGWAGTTECGPDDEELRNWLGDASVSTEEDWIFGYYGGAAERWDRIAYNAPHYLIVKSAGNDRGDNGPNRHCENGRIVNANRPPDGGSDGYDSINGRDIGKNVLAIGAVRDIEGGYENPGDVRAAGFSGFGPADDGRVKPDLVGNGTGLVSSIGSADDAYNSLSGTSMSSPNVSGSVGLLLEHQENLHGSTRLKAATIKGLLIHTADEAGSRPGPDYRFGWGLVNTTKAAHLMSLDDKLGGEIFQERTLAQNDTIRIPLEVSEPGEPLRATINWSDPPGRPPSRNQLDPRNPMLVNDLDLRIVGPDGTPHQPWALNVENPSQAATRADNTVDNTEQVHIADPDPGRYVVEVTHKGQLREEVRGQYQSGNQDVSIILDRKPGERYSIAGRVTLDRDPSMGAGNVTVKLSGFEQDSITTGPDGYYEFAGLYNGDYQVAPSVAGDVTFSPTSQSATVDGADVTDMNFSAATSGERLVTLRLNTATLPDTLAPHDTVTVRGCLDECTDGQSTLPDGNVLARDDRTTLEMTNVGGDYWQVTFAVPDVTPLDFHFFAPLAERDGLGGAEDGDPHHIEAGIGNLAMPLHYFEKGDNQDTTYAWRPWEHSEGGTTVQFRLYLPDGLSPILPPGVRGNDLNGEGPLREEQSRLSLAQEAEDESKPGYRLYSGEAYYPPSTVGASQSYKYTLDLRPWTEAGMRSFVVPAQDTTLHWTYGGNAVPLAGRDELTTEEDTPATLNVLANDRDFDGDSLFIAAVSDGKHGTATRSSDSTVTYMPAPDYDRSDAFTYTLSDGRGGEAEGTVKVTIQGINDAPTAPTGVQPSDTLITIEGAADTPFVAQWDAATDPDDGTLDYTWQLAASEAFETLLTDQGTGDETRFETTFATIDSLLAAAGIEQGTSATLFHRVTVSDGDSTVTGDPFPITLERGAIGTAAKGYDAVPTELVLQNNYPNPFAQNTTLRYALPEPTAVRLAVFDALGRQVRVLVDEQQTSGWHDVHFSASDLPSGVYVYRLQAGGDTQVGHMTLVK